MMWLLCSKDMENLQLKTMNIFDMGDLLKSLWRKTLSRCCLEICFYRMLAIKHNSSLLSTHLWKSGVHVFQAEAFSDTLLVLNAVSKHKLGKTSILVGEDTDLLVLLVAHSEVNMHMLIPNKGKRARKMFNITQLQEVLGSMKEYVLFIHAFTGCDTTSSLHGKGKSLPFVAVFNDESSSPQEVDETGEAFMCLIYGGKTSCTTRCTFIFSLNKKLMVPLERHSYLRRLKLLNSIYFVFPIRYKRGKTGR
ncbi:hypothetical protein PR048_009146 [Dryococelus australis]|uniref:Uncharacterized protein n=1 Tax=Dryococelus australis TaxID=614101 RepID=A0ABQ9HZ31_9NEOP|nr:hypothetical protein PR048_009146 [Dryococelus australis]